MKKLLGIFMAICLLLAVSACGEKEDTRTIQTFLDTLEEAGYTLLEPEYVENDNWVKAVRGVTFYLDDLSRDNIGQIFEFETAEKAKSFVGNTKFGGDGPAVNGRFICSGPNDLKELFLSVEIK